MGCPTVKIQSDVPGIDYFVINEEDFDASRHELYTTDNKPATPIHESAPLPDESAPLPDEQSSRKSRK